MARYLLQGVVLEIPETLMTRPLEVAMVSGKYEHSEADALLRHLRPRDRFLDLGAGVGYLTTLAGRVAGFAAGVEAGPELAAVAQANLDRNEVKGEILWGAVVSDSFASDRAVFSVRRAFWASSLQPPDKLGVSLQVDVPAHRLGALLARYRPTMLSVDIEGGELDLFDAPLPEALRMIVMELHPAVYGLAGTRRIFDALSRCGFAYKPWGSKAATVVMERVGDA